MKLGTKISLGFGAVLVLTAVLGVVSYYNAVKSAASAFELGVNRLPSVQSLLIISEAQTAIDSAENVLLYTKITDADRQAAYKRFDDAKARVDKAWKVYDPLPQTPEEEVTWKKFVPAWNKWMQDHDTYVALYKKFEADKKEESYEAAAKQGVVANGVSFAAAEELLNKLVEINQTCGEVETKQANASAAFAKTLSVIATGLSLVVGILLAVFITRSITGPIRRIADTLAAGADQTASAAGQVSASSQSLAQGASEQAASLEETSSSLEEMSSMTKKNAESAQQAASLSAEAKHAADTGNHSMDKMSSAINEIQKSAAATAKIIKVIDEIAFQTNLLALNAAVEAARAGEAGKGFAVVAEEVRNLAMRSAEAAKNTASMIEESVQNAKNGVAITGEVAKSLQEITGAATKVNALVGEISAASQEQTTGIDQVNKAVGQMDKVTQSNAANAEESASASEELSSQAEQMKGMVAELIALVNGASARGTAAPAHSSKHHAHAGYAGKPKASDAIPFGDEHAHAGKGDFHAFSKAG